MQIGMVGLGRMGANIVRRLQEPADFVPWFTTTARDAVATLAAEGAAARQRWPTL